MSMYIEILVTDVSYRAILVIYIYVERNVAGVLRLLQKKGVEAVVYILYINVPAEMIYMPPLGPFLSAP